MWTTNTLNDGDSPLHAAAALQNLEICKIFFNNVEDELPRNDFHKTPLNVAEERGYSDIVNYFKLFLTSEDQN
jgi:ankyrin repeat protein